MNLFDLFKSKTDDEELHIVVPVGDDGTEIDMVVVDCW